MLDKFASNNNTDKDGNPAGGHVEGKGLHIIWQDGPLGRGEDKKVPNGAFVETVIAAAKQRIEFYQSANDKKFWCRTNFQAIKKLEEALEWLDSRTKDREEREVEGTHTA